MKNNSHNALFSDGILVELRKILEEKYPERKITNSELIEAAVKIIQFIAVCELRKVNNDR